MNAKNWLIKVCVNKGFIWNLRNCGCECDKSYDVGEYLDYENYKCRKKLIDQLVEECSENIDEKEIYPNKAISLVCNSWTMYIILFPVFLTISIGTVLIFIGTQKMKSLLILIMAIKQHFIECNWTY